MDEERPAKIINAMGQKYSSMTTPPRPNGLKVHARQGEEAKKLLVQLGLLEGSKRILRCDGHLVFPLKEPVEGRLSGLRLPGSELVRCDFRARSSRPGNLQEALGRILSKDDISLLGRSYDIIGRILLIALPTPLLDRKREIGRALLSWVPVETVALKTSAVSGDERVRGLEVLAGKLSLETVHKENGLQFRLDLAKVFFNPRLSAERARVAESSKDDRAILDMFAGVGPFSIAVAKASRCDSATIYALDKNEHAVRYLTENIRLNRAWKVVAGVGDSGVEAPKIARKIGKFDRIIMNLPGSSFRFLPSAAASLKAGGHLHYYRLAPRSTARHQIEDELGAESRFRVADIREVESYSPSKSIFVADAVAENSLR